MQKSFINNIQRTTPSRFPNNTSSFPMRRTNDIFRPRSLQVDSSIFSERRILLSSPISIVHNTELDSSSSAFGPNGSNHGLNNCENSLSKVDILNSMSKDVSTSTFTNALLEEYRVPIKEEQDTSSERGYHIDVVSCSKILTLNDSKKSPRTTLINHDNQP